MRRSKRAPVRLLPFVGLLLCAAAPLAAAPVTTATAETVARGFTASADEIRDARFGLDFDRAARQARPDPLSSRRICGDLLRVLRSDGSSEAKAEAAERLARLAGPAEVPALEKLLTHPFSATHARTVLEAIPGREATRALAGGLVSGDPKVRSGILATLARRAEPSTVPEIGRCLADADPRVRVAAMQALAAIPDAAARSALARSAPAPGDPVRRDWEVAMIAAAAGAPRREAVAMWKSLNTTVSDPVTSRAVLVGLARSGDPSVVQPVLAALGDPCAALRGSGIAALRVSAVPGLPSKAAALLPSLAPDARLALVHALAELGDRSTVPALATVLSDASPDVRRAAYGAVAALGGAAEVSALVLAAARETGEMRDAADAAIASTRGTGCDAAVRELLARSAEQAGPVHSAGPSPGGNGTGGSAGTSPAVHAALLRAARNRRLADCVALARAALSSRDRETRGAAFDAMAALGTLADLPDLLRCIVTPPAPGSRSMAEDAFVAAGRRVGADPAARLVVEASRETSGPQVRESLMMVLGRLGAPAGLDVLKAAASDDKDPDAQKVAVRALGNWPGDAPAPVLLELVRGKGSRALRVLALRGYLQIASALPPDQVAKRHDMFHTALGTSPAEPELRLIAAGLAETRDPRALDTLVDLVREGRVRSEASLALTGLAAAMNTAETTRTQAALARALASMPDGPDRDGIIDRLRPILPVHVSERWEGDPFFGDYRGTLFYNNAQTTVAGQVLATGAGRFRVQVLEKFDIPFKPWIVMEGTREGDRVPISGFDWEGEVTTAGVEARIPGKPDVLRLTKSPRLSPNLGRRAPNDAIVLFDGPDFSQFESSKAGSPVTWKLVDGGAMEVAPQTASIQTKRSFRDVELHLEFRSPYSPGNAHQFYGNSGVFLQSAYEVQVLMSHAAPGLPNECGALYNLVPPRVNACAPPLQWQTYDITFRAARFLDGRMVQPARITVVHNGVTVHDNLELPGTTIPPAGPPADPRPIMLQDHHNRVQYRNIWVRELADGAAPAPNKENK